MRFTHVRNPGIAFGISVGDYLIYLAVVSLLATIFIGYLHWKEKNSHILVKTSLGLILGGAIGNLIDRSNIFFINDYIGVVDFIDIGYFGYRWFTFNIADSAVTIGIILYIISS